MNHCISASIIAADYNNLRQCIEKSEEAGVDMIHFDVMDHHYVPNLSIGPGVCQDLAKDCPLPIEAHLMVTDPMAYIDAFAKAGACMLTVHPETCDNPADCLRAIHDAGMQAGIAFNPDQSVEQAQEYIQDVDLVLLMCVFPGFSGQQFIQESIEKIQNCRAWLDQHNPNARLGVDGGIKADNIADCAQAGADFFVMGSGIFATPDYNATLESVRKQLATAQ